jgi:hypothetical protein
MTTSYRMRAVCVLLVPIAVVMSGCGRSAIPATPKASVRTYSQPVPANPPPGQVRIVAEKVQEDATISHWKWTIVGDRNWNGTSGSTEGVELKDSYPLNDPSRGGGTNAFQCEVVISSVKSADGKISLAYRYSLNNIGTRDEGPTVSSAIGEGGISGDSTLGVDVKPTDVRQAAKALVRDEQVLPLPLDQPLVELHSETADGMPIDWSFRLKIPK